MPIFTTTAWRPITVTQWAPTTTVHDPNPPLPLETAFTGTPAGFRSLRGVRRMGAVTGGGGPVLARAHLLPLLGVA